MRQGNQLGVKLVSADAKLVAADAKPVGAQHTNKLIVKT